MADTAASFLPSPDDSLAALDPVTPVDYGSVFLAGTTVDEVAGLVIVGVDRVIAAAAVERVLASVSIQLVDACATQ